MKSKTNSSTEDKELDFKIYTLVQKNPDAVEIPLQLIKEITEKTLDDCPPEDRAVAWLALLEVFPKNPNDWEEEKKNLIESYQSFVKEYKLSDWYNENVPDAVNQSQLNVPDKSLMAQIHSDIVRTGRQIQFFPPDLSREGNPENCVMYKHVGYMRRIERILYVFATNNSTLSYTQGFNELVSPIYYVMLKARYMFREEQDDIEAITYAMLQQLISSTSIHEMYTTQDKSSIILTKLEDFTKLLNKHIPEVGEKIDKLHIHPATYCYRWFNLLFAQEYDLPTLLPLWDILFSHIDELLDYAFYIGLGQMKMCENKIMTGRTTDILYALQNLDISDPKPAAIYAKEYYDADHPKTFFKKLFKSFKDKKANHN